MAITTKFEREGKGATPHIGFVPSNRIMLTQALEPKQHCRESANSATALQAFNAYDIAGAIEALKVGILLLEADGRLVYSNPLVSKLLRRRDGLFLDTAGVLRCHDRAARLKLKTLLEASRNFALKDRQADLGVLTIRRSERIPIAASASALKPPKREGHVEREQSTGRLLLVLRDPDDCLEGCDTRIADIFGLTRSEAQVAAQLVMGDDMKQIADRRSVSLTTVRNQVKSVQSKTGVSRQSALVSLMLRTILF